MVSLCSLKDLCGEKMRLAVFMHPYSSSASLQRCFRFVFKYKTLPHMYLPPSSAGRGEGRCEGGGKRRKGMGGMMGGAPPREGG